MAKKEQYTYRKTRRGTRVIPSQFTAISAGWRYSSGALHAAYDYPLPVGTPIVAPKDCLVLDCSFGVPNNRPGHNPGSGAPSNWVLLGWRTKSGKRVVAYAQHLDPRRPKKLRGVDYRNRKVVKEGMVIGWSGNSGNSTGPHLHWHVWELRADEPWPGRWGRYGNMSNNGAAAVWTPDRPWKAYA
jgi:hypothetical protein